MGGFIEGTWIVRCPAGHDNEVGGVTSEHECETCHNGTKSVTDGSALVVCPNGHTSGVDGVTRHHDCPACGAQCRRD